MAQVWPHQHHHRQPHHHHSSQGVLGKLGNPGKVLGVDISEEMINHCSNHYSGQENLSFQVFTWSDNQLVEVEIEDGFTISPQTLDVSNGADFCQTKESSFNMASRSFQPWHWSHQVTSFSCLHWVPNQPDAVSVFNRVLKPGGKFLFVVRNTVNLVNHCQPSWQPEKFQIAGTHNPEDNMLRREYEAMRNETKWADALRPTKS